jgi:hypothetical protein
LEHCFEDKIQPKSQGIDFVDGLIDSWYTMLRLLDARIQVRIRHYMMNANLKVTVLTLSFWDLELLSVMVRLKESFQPSLEEFELC